MLKVFNSASTLWAEVVMNQCFIQTPKHWAKLRLLGGRLPNEDRRAENRGQKPKAGVGLLGGGSKSLPPARGSVERCELPSWVQGRAPSAQRFPAIFSTQDGLS